MIAIAMMNDDDYAVWFYDNNNYSGLYGLFFFLRSYVRHQSLSLARAREFASNFGRLSSENKCESEMFSLIFDTDYLCVVCVYCLAQFDRRDIANHLLL